MAEAHGGYGSEATEVEDPNTGQRYWMYSLPITGWPGAPRIVYECPTCKGRFSPEDWTRGCPGCAKTAAEARKDGERKDKRRKRKRRG